MGYLEDRAGLTGKVALIAGGGGGLGRAIALDYARAGMQPRALRQERGAARASTVAELGTDTG